MVGIFQTQKLPNLFDMNALLNYYIFNLGVASGTEVLLSNTFLFSHLFLFSPNSVFMFTSKDKEYCQMSGDKTHGPRGMV